MSDSTTFTYANQTVNRLGFGAMRITGEGIWGPPKDPDECRAVLKRAVELGVNLIDTADSYGPYISEELIREALHPYGDVKIATKAGFLRIGPNAWRECGKPDYLRQECEMSLRRLGQESIDLFQLHRIDPAVAPEDQFGLLAELLDEGKVQAVGLSEVSVEQIVRRTQGRHDLDGAEPLQRHQPPE
jgi:aryl-alcohol dehydrogenase-like predicted oxidoreductase